MRKFLLPLPEGAQVLRDTMTTTDFPVGVFLNPIG